MTSTTNMIMIVSIMIAVNVGLTMVQGAIVDINPAGAQFFNVSDSPYSNYVENDTLLVDDSYLPSDAQSVSTDDSGNLFTDTYESIKAWAKETLAPLGFLTNILSQPYGFMNDIGLPQSIALAVGVFWYLFALIIIVSWWMGR